jgi:hypothetical protein
VDGRLSQASADQFLACFGLRERSRGTFRTSKFSMEEHRPKASAILGSRLVCSLQTAVRRYSRMLEIVCVITRGCIGAVLDQQLERDGTSNLAAV